VEETMLPRDFVLAAFLLAFAGAGILGLIYAPLVWRTPPRWLTFAGGGLLAVLATFALAELTGLGCRLGL
jgi:hypothetical protein